MNKTIWKFNLDVTDYQEVAMPVGAKALYAAMQGSTAVLYAHVDPNAPPTLRSVWLHGTGHTTRFSHKSQPLGLLIVNGGALMFHVFIEPES